MKSYRITAGPESNDCCPCREIEDTKEESQVTREAETGVTQPHAKQLPGLPAAPGARTGPRRTLPLSLRGSTVLLTPWFQTSGLQDGEKIKLPVILSLFSVVSATVFAVVCDKSSRKLTHQPYVNLFCPSGWRVAELGAAGA